MGAWGIGPFQNDDGVDEAYNFALAVQEAKADKADRIRRVFTLDEGYLEADDGAEVLAVAALLAGYATTDADAAQWVETVKLWLEAQPAQIVAEWRALARAAVLRVLADDSELAELWDESEDAGEWRGSTQRLADMLA